MTDLTTEALRKLQGEITPGPWSWETDDDTAQPRVYQGPIERPERLIACVGNAEEWGDAIDRWEANARLIAAAPDLLAEVLRLRERRSAC